MTASRTTSVRFDEDSNSVYVFDGRSTDILWPTDEEFQEYRSVAKIDAARLRKQGLDKLLEDTFAAPGSDVQKQLTEYARSTEGRGIERHTCESHYDERMKQRTLAIKAVLIGQMQGRKQGLHMEDVAEQLRELSLEYSCAGKIFARRMGKADEAAVHKKASRRSSMDSACSSKSGRSVASHKSSSRKSQVKISASKTSSTAAPLSQKSCSIRHINRLEAAGRSQILKA